MQSYPVIKWSSFNLTDCSKCSCGRVPVCWLLVDAVVQVTKLNVQAQLFDWIDSNDSAHCCAACKICQSHLRVDAAMKLIAHYNVFFRPKSTVIADLGCGEAKIAQELTRNKVHSFDLIALNDHVTVCDMSKVSLLLSLQNVSCNKIYINHYNVGVLEVILVCRTVCRSFPLFAMMHSHPIV